MPRPVFVLLLFPVAVGCALDVDAAGGASEALRFGNPVDSVDGVVGLTFEGETRCTATRVGDRALLTAAHCVSPAAPDAAFVGRSIEERTRSIAVVSTHAHPGFDPADLANDVAVVLLVSPPDEAGPPVRLGGPGSVRPGARVRMAGYGVTELEQPGGTLHEGTGVVGLVGSATFELEPGPARVCYGDSGGPVFTEGPDGVALVGVVSHGDRRCEDVAVATRVDAHLDGIASAFAPEPEAATGLRSAPVVLCSAGSGVPPPRGRAWVLGLCSLGLAIRRPRARRPRRPTREDGPRCAPSRG